MYRDILVAVDNSDWSNYGLELAVGLGRKFGARLTGNHVYAARLHDERFRQMEAGLPRQYHEEETLQRQRQVHDSLIGDGLVLITDSYLDVVEERCREAGLECRRHAPEGKNFAEIVRDVESHPYDLLVMGAWGLGRVRRSLLGSVCERVTRRVRVDTLVVKNDVGLDGGRLVVAVDGSPHAFAAVSRALALGRAFDAPVEAVGVFDPFFHTVAFRSIAGVLSEEAGQVFRFREQEQLHDEIIDQGLAKVYERNLKVAQAMAGEEGMELETALLEGKPFDAILTHVEADPPALLLVGRFGVHHHQGADLGSNAENLLRLAPCNVLLVGQALDLRRQRPDLFAAAEAMPWTDEALARLERVPPFVRGMVRRAVEDRAREQGHTVVTADLVGEVGKGRGHRA